MARDMEARRELAMVGRVMSVTAGAGVHGFREDTHDMDAEDAMLAGASAIAHMQTLESHGLTEEAGGDTSHAVIERECETHGSDIVSAFIAAEARHGDSACVAGAQEGEASGEKFNDFTVAEPDAAWAIPAEVVHCRDTEVRPGDAEDEVADATHASLAPWGERHS
ncbi:hypothetical protein CBR_g42053 [Chara braunii]|uniref:Uncharacterized protein n=1 Tax=Chara braunii TaxID=69332 RepID=A0A388LWR9_CHABU|nr:hypothetical protein CBR_g42053 [Chara braunii]|eukprot:GBG86768.1 hypothetical protein CBR_g42053 [Chara braunii]